MPMEGEGPAISTNLFIRRAIFATVLIGAAVLCTVMVAGFPIVWFLAPVLGAPAGIMFVLQRRRGIHVQAAVLI